MVLLYIGCVLIRLFKIDNWVNPSKELQFEEYILTSNKSQILHIPGGLDFLTRLDTKIS